MSDKFHCYNQQQNQTGFGKMCIVRTKQNVEKTRKLKNTCFQKKLLTCITVFIPPSRVFLRGFNALAYSQLQ